MEPRSVERTHRGSGSDGNADVRDARAEARHLIGFERDAAAWITQHAPQLQRDYVHPLMASAEARDRLAQQRDEAADGREVAANLRYADGQPDEQADARDRLAAADDRQLAREDRELSAADRSDFVDLMETESQTRISSANWLSLCDDAQPREPA
jgi:hypothetical protein